PGGDLPPEGDTATIGPADETKPPAADDPGESPPPSSGISAESPIQEGGRREGEAGALRSWSCPARVLIPDLLRRSVARTPASSPTARTGPAAGDTSPGHRAPGIAPAPRRWPPSSNPTPSRRGSTPAR